MTTDCISVGLWGRPRPHLSFQRDLPVLIMRTQVQLKTAMNSVIGCPGVLKTEPHLALEVLLVVQFDLAQGLVGTGSLDALGRHFGVQTACRSFMFLAVLSQKLIGDVLRVLRGRDVR